MSRAGPEGRWANPVGTVTTGLAENRVLSGTKDVPANANRRGQRRSRSRQGVRGLRHPVRRRVAGPEPAASTRPTMERSNPARTAREGDAASHRLYCSRRAYDARACRNSQGCTPTRIGLPHSSVLAAKDASRPRSGPLLGSTRSDSDIPPRRSVAPPCSY